MPSVHEDDSFEALLRAVWYEKTAEVTRIAHKIVEQRGGIDSPPFEGGLAHIGEDRYETALRSIKDAQLCKEPIFTYREAAQGGASFGQTVHENGSEFDRIDAKHFFESLPSSIKGELTGLLLQNFGEKLELILDRLPEKDKKA